MIVNLIKKYKELILYGIFGLGATLVNIIAFYLLRKGGISLIPSNCLAWFFAFVFAFVTNKVIVFGSTDWKSGKAVYELITFTAARLGTLVVDTAMMYAMVDLMKINDLISKVVVNIVVIIINYVLSKFVIFNKKEDLRISKDTITDMITNIVNTVYNKTEWYRKNKFFNSMFFKYTVLFCIKAFIAFLQFIKYH